MWISRRLRILFPIAMAGSLSLGTTAGTVRVDPAKSVIVLPAGENARLDEAAAELGRHLELMTGVAIPTLRTGATEGGLYPFSIGLARPGDAVPPAPEDARWAVGPEGAYFYGDARNGALYAVYGFLEDQLGVRWIEPGEAGLVCPARPALELTPGESRWVPRLAGRTYRQSRIKDPRSPAAIETEQWLRRMRTGAAHGLRYGHAFGSWWARYGQDHPEYFALTSAGRRAPIDDSPVSASQIKVCPGNPCLAGQIVANWLAEDCPPSVNVCENDTPPVEFCRCGRCLALDARAEGDPPMARRKGGCLFLTDRYVHLANETIRQARRHRPDVKVVLYAYDQTEFAPERVRLEPNLVVGLAPKTIDLAVLEPYLDAWRAMGAREFFLRPNYPWWYHTGSLPVGFEKHLGDLVKFFVRKGVTVVDIDSLMHHWPNFGLADYVLAKTLTDPDKPFERWEDEYLSAFGTAAPEARAYFAFWRSRWDAQILPNLGEILGTSCDFTRGLYRDAARYYQVETFDQAEALLAPAAAKPLGPAERRQLDRAILSVRHAKQVFLALTSQGTEQHRQARRLLDFRERNRDRLNFLWANLEAAEIRMGDATGIRKAALFRDYLDDYFALPRTWFFALDPGNAGLAEKWPDKPIADLRREGWVKLSTAYWMRSPQKSGLPYDPDFLERVRSYRGAAWYGAGAAIPPEWKGREIFLYFLSAPSACRVFVNGRPAGDSAAAGSGGAARVARIDAQVDWMKPEQAILVRIEDTEGRGLNDAVYAVSRPAPAPEAP